jgi:hypothetical protein
VTLLRGPPADGFEWVARRLSGRFAAVNGRHFDDEVVCDRLLGLRAEVGDAAEAQPAWVNAQPAAAVGGMRALATSC